MPGIPTQFVVLEKTIAALKASSQELLRNIAKVMEQHSPYAYFGAVGPKLGDFIPSGPGVVGQYVKIWHRVFDLVGGWGTPGHPGLYSLITSTFTVLDQLDAIAKAEDRDQAQAIKPKLEQFSNTFGAASILLGELKTRAEQIKERIEGSGPMLPSVPGRAVPSIDTWLIRDVLHWRKTGAFAKALLAHADKTDDDRFRAYAYGYVTAYSANVTGAPFINSIVLGPYRTAWWRHRFVQNWIDAWVYGAESAGATIVGDKPVPDYTDPAWSSLCVAQLQKKIELAGVMYDPVDLMNHLPKGLEKADSKKGFDPFPILLPPEFGKFWVEAYTQAYGPLAPDSPVKPDALNDAYIMTWLMLWFQTASLGCNPAPSAKPPDDCGTKPSWVDPSTTTPGDNGAGGAPPPSPDSYEQVDTAEEVCGWIIAILGALVCAVGALGPGGAAIAIGVELIADAHSTDWKKLRCDLYWYRMYFYNMAELVHSLLLISGIDFPRAAELASNEETAPFIGTNYLSGVNLCKSRDRRQGFPSKPWVPTVPGDWTKEPTTWEEKQQVAYLTATYPSFFVDGPANPLSNGEVRIGGNWPPGYRESIPGSSIPVQFGNAVLNAVDLFTHLNELYPEWNLDADRGLAFMAWQFHNAFYTDPVVIDPEN